MQKTMAHSVLAAEAPALCSDLWIPERLHLETAGKGACRPTPDSPAFSTASTVVGQELSFSDGGFDTAQVISFGADWVEGDSFVGTVVLPLFSD